MFKGTQLRVTEGIVHKILLIQTVFYNIWKCVSEKSNSFLKNQIVFGMDFGVEVSYSEGFSSRKMNV